MLAGGQGEVLLVRAKFLTKLVVSGKGPYTRKHKASGLLCSELMSPSSAASGRNSSPSTVLGGAEKP